jgi:hypothetical protein
MSYFLINQALLNQKRGRCTNNFLRYIGTGDSLFRLFLRSFGHRSPVDLQGYRPEFVVYDKNQNNIDIFKYLLSWDGDLNSLFELTLSAEEKFSTPMVIDLDNYQKHIPENFYNIEFFKACWQAFRQSKFEFHHVDLVDDTNKFLAILSKLTKLDNNKNQYMYMGFNRSKYKDSKFDFALNEILHRNWTIGWRFHNTLIELVDSTNSHYENYAGKLYAQLNPVFCILPWNHIQYKPDGQSKLCCRYDTVYKRSVYEKITNHDHINDYMKLTDQRPSIRQQDIDSVFYTSPYWQTARQHILNNQSLEGCHKCYKEEQADNETDVGLSMRLGSNILYNHGYLHRRPKFPNPRLEFLEVGFGNYCNMACLTCNSNLSTTWHDDELKLNSMLSEKDSNLKRIVYPKLDNLQFKLSKQSLLTVNLVKFTGGEPMINPEFVKFIDQICEQGKPEQVSLEIYTNCSYIPSARLLANLNRFKKIYLNLSIDGYGSLNDYIRYPSIWSGEKHSVSSALTYWLEISRQNDNFLIIMSTTLSVLNVYNIQDLITWWTNQYRNYFNEDNPCSLDSVEYDGFFKIQPAFDPSYLSVNILPKSYYKNIIDWCDNYQANFTSIHPRYTSLPESILVSVKKIRKLCSGSKGNHKLAEQFMTYIEKMEKIRSNKLADVNPILLANLHQFINSASSG